MWWMWIAGPVMILGTVVALWPQQIRQNTLVEAHQPIGPESSDTRILS